MMSMIDFGMSGFIVPQSTPFQISAAVRILSEGTSNLAACNYWLFRLQIVQLIRARRSLLL